MSEIVRPTRDGIHGREYINTSVDVGRKLPYLRFHEGQMALSPPPLLELPMPVLFDVVPAHWQRGPVVEAIARAAAELGTMAVVAADVAPEWLDAVQGRVVPLLDAEGSAANGSKAPLVMLPDGPNVMAVQASVKSRNAGQIVAVRVTATPAAAKHALELARAGAEVIHLVFDSHGREADSPAPRHLRDVLRDVHTTLVKAGVRDEVTIIASGGIALAEHMAKAIICGADLVAVDIPLVLALECRLCGECQKGNLCPIDLDEMDLDWGVHRIVNLIGAWHQQLIEVLGAMGIREVRRLRGETGRCMFFEDLERETFGRLFGKRVQASASGAGASVAGDVESPAS